jgi:hypothetical protein
VLKLGTAKDTAADLILLSGSRRLVRRIAPCVLTAPARRPCQAVNHRDGNGAHFQQHRGRCAG